MIVSSPRLVLAIAFTLAAVSVTLTVTRLGMLTDQLALIRKDHPLIALSDRLDPFNSETKRRLDVVIEAPTPFRAVSFVKELSTLIAKDTAHFQKIFYRVDPEPLKKWQLFYLDEKKIGDLGNNLDAHAAFIQAFAKQPDILNFLNLLNREMASRMVGEIFTGFLDDGSGKDKAEPFDLSFLIDTLEGMSNTLHGETGFKSPWFSLLKSNSWDPDLEGYFWQADKRYLLAFVTPQKSHGEVVATKDSLEQLRKYLGELRASYPDVKTGVTGQEALNNDQMTTVMDDMSVATWLSILAVFILLVTFRRSFRRPLLQTISLTVGICWSFGCATLVVGHLNMISVVFAPLLCGLGVDPAIHWFSRLEEEERHGGGMAEVIRIVNERSGPAIILAGMGTAISFLPFALTGFRGLMELGIIAGMGILVTLFADFTVLPALTVLLGGKARNGAEPEGRDLIRLDLKAARRVLVGAGILAAFCILPASQVYFDLNPLRLQTANAESVVWEKNLITNSRQSAIFASSFASSPEELKEKTREFEALPSVSEVESVFTILPEDQDKKIPLLRALRPKIPEMSPAAHKIAASDVRELIDVLERIRFKLQDEQAQRWGAERPLVDQMTRARNLTRDITDTLRSLPNAAQRLVVYQDLFLQDLRDRWDSLREGTTASPMGVEDLPDTLRGWFYQDGTYLMRIFPKESVWEQYALSKFVEQLQSVDPTVVGDPVSLYVFASAFKDACIRASAFAVIAIFLLLFLTFRDMRLVLITLIPLGLGGIWTIAMMGVADVQFNLANSIFMPLIVGAGVEYAVVIVGRWKEGRMTPGHLPLSTGKGVVLAALTTTFGFGVLMISRHGGIFSLGLVSAVGSLCVLLSAIFVLPAILANMAHPAPRRS